MTILRTRTRILTLITPVFERTAARRRYIRRFITQDMHEIKRVICYINY